MVLEELKENETVKWAVNLFVKIGLGLFVTLGTISILHDVLGFTFDISAGLGI